MVSTQIANLSEDDLILLEQIIGREFSQESAEQKSKTLLRLINAVRSQRNLAKMPKW